MRTFNTAFNPELIASQLSGEKHFINNVTLNNVAELIEANNNSICFFENPKFIDKLKSSRAGLILVPIDFDIELKPDTNLLKVAKTYITFMMLVKKWLKLDSSRLESKIAGTAVVSKTATIGAEVSLSEYCILSENVIVGDRTQIDANVVIKENVKIGKNCKIYPNVTIYDRCEIGDNVVIHAGCVIGADGFGYLLHEGKQNKIPQVGNVVIEDDVEIGANSSVDRATLGSTIIRKGTKIDNLVQVGHNCVVGKNSILCAQSGLAGSTEIGDLVYIAGQVGVAGHLKIDDGAMIGAQSGVTNDIPEGAKCFGTPAIDAGLRKRIMASEKKLPEVVRYFNKLKKKERES